MQVVFLNIRLQLYGTIYLKSYAIVILSAFFVANLKLVYLFSLCHLANVSHLRMAFTPHMVFNYNYNYNHNSGHPVDRGGVVYAGVDIHCQFE
jgi:uncharacterized membrane protein